MQGCQRRFVDDNGGDGVDGGDDNPVDGGDGGDSAAEAAHDAQRESHTFNEHRF